MKSSLTDVERRPARFVTTWHGHVNMNPDVRFPSSWRDPIGTASRRKNRFCRSALPQQLKAKSLTKIELRKKEYV